ncbi:hypothetical protein LAT59_04115, partial [Candidatus Gracilibacteria bacterium]|nr:hypothetical protein [Candidatus Gracilibacteria bacterium]
NDLKIDYQGEIEFLGQNQIEEFATDYFKFSKAIYSRLENKEELEKSSEELKEYIENLDEYIINTQEIEKNKVELGKLDKKLENYKSIIEVVKGEEYNRLKKEFDKHTNDFYKIEQSKGRFHKLKDELNSFINNFSPIDTEENDYDTRYNNIYKTLLDLKNEVEGYDFAGIEKIQNNYSEKSKFEKEGIKTYLSKKGMTEEKLLHLEEAQEGLLKGKIEQEKYNSEMRKLLEIQKLFNIEEGRLNFEEYKSLVEKGLKIAESKLNEITNENIKKFKFIVGFDIGKAKENLFKDFMNTFEDYYENRLIRDKIYETLFNTDIKKILNGEINEYAFIEIIDQLGYGKSNDFLKNIFKSKCNFEIYRILIAKYLYNLNNYLKIEILYDERPIESSSFGQKCTVVILIILLFGKNPIIIDEPEAHLDSSLIANFLVDLIKQRKKERQIIFATHNANFVINGDAEQVYILENENNKTNFTQTSIENLDNRSRLLQLEGGREAFNKRSNKYVVK